MVLENGNAGPGGRLTDHISLGVLTGFVHHDLVDDVLVATGRVEKRSRKLPARVMVYFTLAMWLFFDDDYEEVMEKLVAGLKVFGWWRDWEVPTGSGITHARKRLGEEPLRVLFERAAEPIGHPGLKGGFLTGRRLMVIDGFSLDVPDTAANREEFEKLQDGPKASAYPKVQVLGLVECGTRAFLAAALGGCRTGETTLARQILGRLEPGMLVIADRNFYGYDLWRAAAETGADLMWRVKANLTLPVLESFADGSYRSVVLAGGLSAGRRRNLVENARHGVELDSAEAMTVRVVEYEITDRGDGDGTETICLITTVLDPADTPAPLLAAAYSERWQEEISIGELKISQRGNGRVLRSKTPEMVRQEVWAMLLTHHVIRKVMADAAEEVDIDPDRLSFTRALRVIRRHITGPADFSP
ncbi:IS4 family transposase [Frankia torreyi]|uniref:IS4 family transposase n=2 Tax=Frankia TaxID=1854 RepID=UPI0005D11ECD|nr:IS4 family transposase [Frankia torreyi]